MFVHCPRLLCACVDPSTSGHGAYVPAAASDLIVGNAVWDCRQLSRGLGSSGFKGEVPWRRRAPKSKFRGSKPPTSRAFAGTPMLHCGISEGYLRRADLGGGVWGAADR
jgi:hypothetical protein